MKKSMTWNSCAQIACLSAIAARCQWISWTFERWKVVARKMACDFRVAHINLNKFLARRVWLNNRLIFPLHCPKFDQQLPYVHHYPTSVRRFYLDFFFFLTFSRHAVHKRFVANTAPLFSFRARFLGCKNVPKSLNNRFCATRPKSSNTATKRTAKDSNWLHKLSDYD